MKKFLGTALAALAIVLVVAAPALAQRDPFDPVIDLTVDTSGAGEPGSDGTDSTGTGDTDPTSNPDARADVFPNTGADTSGWLAIAYVLLASGVGLVVFSKAMSPAAQLPRSSRG